MFAASWPIILFFALASALLLAPLVLIHKWRVRIHRERDVLLREKEVVLGFIHSVGEVFAEAESVEMNELLERILHYAVRTCQAASGAIYLPNSSENRLDARALSGVFPPPFGVRLEAVEQNRGATGLLEKIVREMPIPIGRGLIGEAAILGNAILLEDAEVDSRVPRHAIDFLRIRTMLVVPMRFGNHVVGVMVLINRTTSGFFSGYDLYLAQALAAQAAVPIHYAGLQEALEQKRQMDRDMRIARQIQNSLLPRRLPAFPSVELAAFSHPAMEIGGDYYDCVEIDDLHVGLVIADVSGKGVGGALMMAVCRNVLREKAPNVRDPSDMLRSLNVALRANLAEDMFVSMLYMVVNLETHLLSYARAGHEPPLMLRDGRAVALPSPGTAIGLTDDATFDETIETRSATLRPGDLLLAYTDGVTEAMNAEGEEWGLDRLAKTLEERPRSSAKEQIERIRRGVFEFTGQSPQSDDMTMLAIKIAERTEGAST